MKKLPLFLLLLGIIIAFSNCKKEDVEEVEEDLTIEIIGEYIGGYGNNEGADINPYEVIVSKIENNRILVAPKTANEFGAFEIEIRKLSTTNIVSPTDNTQETERSVTFAIGTPINMNLNIDPLGEGHFFSGEKQ